MEENIILSVPPFKIYKDRAIFIGSLIGGPLVAGYLIAENFRKFGDLKKAKVTWIIAIATIIVVSLALSLVPALEKIPGYVIPIAYSGSAQLLAKKYQNTDILSHVDQGGQVYSIWRAAAVGLIGLFILLVIIFGIVLFIEPEILQL